MTIAAKQRATALSIHVKSGTPCYKDIEPFFMFIEFLFLIVFPVFIFMDFIKNKKQSVRF